jgi:hypothetical protein
MSFTVSITNTLSDIGGKENEVLAKFITELELRAFESL